MTYAHLFSLLLDNMDTELDDSKIIPMYETVEIISGILHLSNSIEDYSGRTIDIYEQILEKIYNATSDSDLKQLILIRIKNSFRWIKCKTFVNDIVIKSVIRYLEKYYIDAQYYINEQDHINVVSNKIPEYIIKLQNYETFKHVEEDLISNTIDLLHEIYFIITQEDKDDYGSEEIKELIDQLQKIY